MLLLLHVLIAFFGIAISGILLLSPSKRKLMISYFLVAATFLTGTFLIILKPEHLVQACFTGIIYLGIVGIMIYAAQKKLSRLDSSSR